MPGKRLLLQILPDPQKEEGRGPTLVSGSCRSAVRMITVDALVPSLDKGSWFAALELKDAFSRTCSREIPAFHGGVRALPVPGPRPWGLLAAPVAFTEVLLVQHTYTVTATMYIPV